MNILLDIAGSIITGGMVLLIHLGLISRMTAVSTDLLLSNINAHDAVEVTKIIENDFYKAGYRDTTGNTFTTTLDTAIQFKAPVNPDSLPKTINYYLGSVSQLSSTKNPNDRPLFRQIAGENALLIGVVRDFRLAYLDSLGNAISSTNLLTQLQKNKVRGIGVSLRIESNATVTQVVKNNVSTDVYPVIEWKRSIFPRNTRDL